MLTKKKKIVILCGMVALLIVTGVLNIVLNNAAGPVEGTQDNRSLFQTYRADRTATRDQTMLYLDAIIASEASSGEAKIAAEAQKLALVQYMEMELALEALIKATGFSDAFITMSTENINIIVKADSLTEDEANRILSIIIEETGRSPLNVVVVPLSTQS